MSDTVEGRLAALEKRLQHLEDVREINELMRRWHYGCTGGFNGHQTHRISETVDLIAEDGGIEVQGLHGANSGPRGREEMLKYFEPYEGVLPMVYQTGVDYGVEIDGDKATQLSNLLCVTRYANPDIKPEFLLARYNNDYVRTPDGWRIHRIRLEQAYKTTLNDLISADEYRPPKVDEAGVGS